MDKENQSGPSNQSCQSSRAVEPQPQYQTHCPPQLCLSPDNVMPSQPMPHSNRSFTLSFSHISYEQQEPSRSRDSFSQILNKTRTQIFFSCFKKEEKGECQVDCSMMLKDLQELIEIGKEQGEKSFQANQSQVSQKNGRLSRTQIFMSVFKTESEPEKPRYIEISEISDNIGSILVDDIPNETSIDQNGKMPEKEAKQEEQEKDLPKQNSQKSFQKSNEHILEINQGSLHVENVEEPVVQRLNVLQLPSIQNLENKQQKQQWESQEESENDFEVEDSQLQPSEDQRIQIQFVNQEEESSEEREEDEEQEEEEEEEEEEVEDEHGEVTVATHSNTIVEISPVEQSKQDLKSYEIGKFLKQNMDRHLISSLKATMGKYDSSNYFHVGPRYELLGFMNRLASFVTSINAKTQLFPIVVDNASENLIKCGKEVREYLTRMKIQSINSTCGSYSSSNYFHVGPRYSIFGDARKIIQIHQRTL